VLTSLLLPPLVLVLAGLLGILLAWRGWRPGLLLAAGAALAQLLLATPLAARLLVLSLDATPPAGPGTPGAIVVLGGDVAAGRAGAEVGPLTLERLRAGAALHRASGLPLLVTGGPLRPGQPAVGTLMAASLREDFGVPVRWVEDRSRDTWENAALSAPLLREAGIGTVHLVTHGWHMPRSMEVFARRGLASVPAPVRRERPLGVEASDFLPRADWWGVAWYALREQAGRLVYALRG
jgi:uncharacterized SAM-binding protein YcdF (DUF218 family)